MTALQGKSTNPYSLENFNPRLTVINITGRQKISKDIEDLTMCLFVTNTNICFCLNYLYLFNPNSERDGNTRSPDLPLEKPICRSGSNS